MDAELLVVAVLSFLFGSVSKLADLTNEHGLRWVRGASPALGLVWGGLGGALVLVDPYVGAVVVATTLYWYLRVKLEYFNHAAAGVIILVVSLLAARAGDLPLGETFAVLAWITASGYVNTVLKQRLSHRPLLQRFLRLRLRYYVAPLVLAVYAETPAPVVAIVVGMFGTELVTIWFERARTRGESSVARAAGLIIPAPMAPEHTAASAARS
jgi:hypothetical protein